MATNEGTTPRSGGVLSTIGTLVSILMMVAVIGAVVLITLPYATPLPALLTLPTASVARPAPGSVVVPQAQPVNVQQDIDKYNADQQATAAAIPVPNVNNTGDSAPSVREQKEDSRPAPPPPGDASVQEAPSDSFGSKPVDGPVNIQETHQCLHGQVWTATGCHRPTPVQP